MGAPQAWSQRRHGPLAPPPEPGREDEGEQPLRSLLAARPRFNLAVSPSHVGGQPGQHTAGEKQRPLWSFLPFQPHRSENSGQTGKHTHTYHQSLSPRTRPGTGLAEAGPPRAARTETPRPCAEIHRKGDAEEGRGSSPRQPPHLLSTVPSLLGFALSACRGKS